MKPLALGKKMSVSPANRQFQPAPGAAHEVPTHLVRACQVPRPAWICHRRLPGCWPGLVQLPCEPGLIKRSHWNGRQCCMQVMIAGEACMIEIQPSLCSFLGIIRIFALSRLLSAWSQTRLGLVAAPRAQCLQGPAIQCASMVTKKGTIHAKGILRAL